MLPILIVLGSLFLRFLLANNPYQSIRSQRHMVLSSLGKDAITINDFINLPEQVKV
jgi:hypothetical protein